MNPKSLAERFGTVGLVLHPTSSAPPPLHPPVAPWTGHNQDVLFNPAERVALQRTPSIVPGWWWRWSLAIVAAGVLLALVVR